MKPPDCGMGSCRYAKPRTGMRPVGSCKCDECPECGGTLRPTFPTKHRSWCPQPEWLPEHYHSQEKP